MKRKLILSVGLGSLMLGGVFFTNFSANSSECSCCYYKEKNCIFKEGTKCTGCGEDCGNESECGGDGLAGV